MKKMKTPCFETLHRGRRDALVRRLGATVLCLLASAALSPARLQAAPVTMYSNGFESYSTVATSFADEADCDPTGAEWNVADDTALNPTTVGAGVQVINWLAHSGSKSLLLRSGSEAQVYLTNAVSGARYTLDFWVYAARGTGDRNWFVTVRGLGADSNGDDYFAYRTDRAATSNLWYFDGISTPNTWVDTTVDHVDNQWQHHRLVIDSASQTTAIYVDNMETPVVASGDLARPDVAVPSLISLRHEGNSADDGYCAIDDLSFAADDHFALSPITLSSGAVKLNWTRTGALKYRVQRGTTLDNLQFISGEQITTSFTDNSPPGGGAFYRVVAYRDLSTTFTEGFEHYPARTSAADDADPQGPWITVESDGNGAGKVLAPGKVQVVNSSVVTPHSGTNCLKLEAGQRAGASLAWGVPPLSDVQITWWARVPEAIQSGPTADAVLLRMSLYGTEGVSSYAGDSALLGHGIRRQSNTNCVDGTSLIYFSSGWQDTTADYTPDVWEEYRLTTHNSQGTYTILKNPSSANPVLVVDRAPFVGAAATWGPTFLAGWSSSNGTNHPPVYVDDIEIKSLVSNPNPLGDPYTITNYGTRFTNVTIVTVGGAVGRPVVDPRDNKTILFTTDIANGGIYQATNSGPGAWTINPTPIVSGLDRPSGLAIQTNGTIWWTHDFNPDFSRAVARLKWPWSNNVPETIIADISPSGTPDADDDAIDVTVAPFNFSGSVGQPGWIVVADRGVDGDAPNALYVVDPATTSLNQTNLAQAFLVAPTPGDLGNNLTAITSLPASGEVASLSQDGTLVAVNGNGAQRYINALNLWPIGGSANGVAIAVDPTTGKIWGADDLKDEVWSIDATTGADVQEIGFPLGDPLRPDRQIDFHDPGMAFAPDGAFMVITDGSLSNGTGGRLIIFHNE